MVLLFPDLETWQEIHGQGDWGVVGGLPCEEGSRSHPSSNQGSSAFMFYKEAAKNLAQWLNNKIGYNQRVAMVVSLK